MADRIYRFLANTNIYTGVATQNAAVGGGNNHIFLCDNTNVPGATYTYPTGESTFANVRNAVNTLYQGDPLLAGQVIAMGYGFQKWVVPKSGKSTITVRGGCGGSSGTASSVINYTGTSGLSTLGATLSGGGLGGRGAKLVGEVNLNAGDVLYLLVGNRGSCATQGVGGNWGMPGGGASVVARENPNGAFTILGRRVEILMVAAGGGGTTSCRAGYNGGDGNPAQGVNTNAGVTTSLAAAGGGGLTGASSLVYTTASSYPFALQGLAVLSGTPSMTANASTLHAPSWGGGGCGWYSGGGGGGYSGGNSGTGTAATSGNQGYGGTSYTNPNLVSAMFRGHEYDRNLSPWTLPGEITLTLPSKDAAEWFLARDSQGNKGWESAQRQWALIPNQGELTPMDFSTYGAVPSIDGFAGLQPSNVIFYCSSPYTSKQLIIEGLARYQVIESNFELDMTAVDSVTSWQVNGNTGAATIKVALSVDHGLTYNILGTGYMWQKIDISNRDLFFTQGIVLGDLNTIPIAKWKELGATNLRLAFIIQQTAQTASPVLQSITLVCNLLGGWRKARHGNDYDYEYIAPQTCKVTINTGGDYKVNYLDRVQG
ncbi:MAG: hypothetical protein FWE40_02940 [Oscillospiraceae bacterium]|nr:hypothetical protein [Oscillospiraceae bacterium]